MAREVGSVRGTTIRNPSPRRYLTAFACECRAARRKCTERVYLNVGAYDRAAALGRVVHKDHLDGPVIERHLTYAIVAWPKEDA